MGPKVARNLAEKPVNFADCWLLYTVYNHVTGLYINQLDQLTGTLNLMHQGKLIKAVLPKKVFF